MQKYNEYWLVQNLLYNCKHIKKVNWFRRLLGKPNLFVDSVIAANEDEAEKKFIEKGHHMGIFHGMILEKHKIAEMRKGEGAN
ncbi:hypothetical protein [Vibrio phage vB_VpM-pA2SJ1]|uniref:Uncharacterized protein n=1 Tax=Vibrio phage vB_VpM-pA2SJ1 TaxID=3095964 RepID=A0AAX4J5V7_9CAUD